MDAARRRPADGPPRPHRHRSLPGEPRHPLRDRRERQPAQADRAGSRSATPDRPKPERVRRRQRGLPHRRRRADVEEDARRQHQHRQQGGLLLQHPARRSRATRTTSPSSPTRCRTRATAARRGRARRGRRKGMFVKAFGDFRVMWWDQQNPDRILVGSDGGFYVVVRPRQDGRSLHEPPRRRVLRRRRRHGRPVQRVRRHAGPRLVEGPEQQLVGRGERRRLDHRRRRATACTTASIPTDARWLYNTSQFGDHQRVDQTQRTMTDIMPRRPKGQPPLRWNWNTPLVLSPHNPQILYTGRPGAAALAQPRRLRGRRSAPTSRPTTTAKTFGRGNIQFCTITTISESPVTRRRDLDRHRRRQGAGHADERRDLDRRDGGHREGRRAARPRGSAASSRRATTPGTAYVAKNGFRQDDFTPYLFKTTDYGATWTSIGRGLPDQPINVVWQDRQNPRLLFVGNDKGVWVSIDDGARWVRMKGNMPNVPVHDLLVHPRERDLIVGTYGRGDLHHGRVGAAAAGREGAGRGRARVRHRAARARSRRAGGATTTSTAIGT